MSSRTQTPTNRSQTLLGQTFLQEMHARLPREHRCCCHEHRLQYAHASQHQMKPPILQSLTITMQMLMYRQISRTLYFPMPIAGTAPELLGNNKRDRYRWQHHQDPQTRAFFFIPRLLFGTVLILIRLCVTLTPRTSYVQDRSCLQNKQECSLHCYCLAGLARSSCSGAILSAKGFRS